jgi:hypothetical protein
MKDLHMSVGVMKDWNLKTRLIDEKFESVIGECVFVKL